MKIGLFCAPFTFGYAFSGIPILGFGFRASGFSSSGHQIWILGGVHGDELEGVSAAHALCDSLWTTGLPKVAHFNYRMVIVPCFNPDGVYHQTRVNGRGIDLNRNLPTKDWTPEIKNPRYPPGPSANSEPENQALVEFINKNKTEGKTWIISLHSFKNPTLNVNGKCEREAHVISKLTKYTITDDMGYPTPGCLGTYGSQDCNIPTLTYELLRGMTTEEIKRVHVPAILEACTAFFNGATKS